MDVVKTSIFCFIPLSSFDYFWFGNIFAEGGGGKEIGGGFGQVENNV